MGKSGSLVQAAGSAAFLSPELGEQQSRNVPWREETLAERKKKARRNKKKKQRTFGGSWTVFHKRLATNME